MTEIMQRRTSIWRVVRTVLIILIAAYVGIIGAVTVHEAVGHGLVAEALGTSFIINCSL